MSIDATELLLFLSIGLFFFLIFPIFHPTISKLFTCDVYKTNLLHPYVESDGDSDNDRQISASAEIIEENNYYPFGLKHTGYSAARRWTNFLNEVREADTKNPGRHILSE